MVRYESRLVYTQKIQNQYKETSSCILRDHSKAICNHPFATKNLKCDYGLTEVEVPKECPLKLETLRINIKLARIEE